MSAVPLVLLVFSFVLLAIAGWLQPPVPLPMRLLSWGLALRVLVDIVAGLSAGVR